MRTFQQVGALRAYLRGIRAEGKAVAFVPTMGALHEGHMSLFRRAKSDSDLVVASIFVNPKQFGPNEDLVNYPRDLPRDLRILANEGVDALFQPDLDEIYPAGFETVVDVPELASRLEGAHRPGHFRGVATVVTKLLNIVRPHRAYFGQKDYQQLLIVESLVRDLNIPTEIIAVPTSRDVDGLALSSRNAYLSATERSAATVLYRAIQQADAYVESGNTDVEALHAQLAATISNEPLASVDYIALVDPEILKPVESLQGSLTLLALAVEIGNTRLIDNALIAPPGVPRTRRRAGRG
jgi:pantoate--beta-alanine ligase